MGTVLLVLFLFIGLIIVTTFLNAVTNKKMLRGKEGIIFDMGKYSLILLLILTSVHYESLVGIILFSLVLIYMIYLKIKNR